MGCPLAGMMGPGVSFLLLAFWRIQSMGYGIWDRHGVFGSSQIPLYKYALSSNIVLLQLHYENY
jgi:hypothetical protein